MMLGLNTMCFKNGREEEEKYENNQKILNNLVAIHPPSIL